MRGNDGAVLFCAVIMLAAGFTTLLAVPIEADPAQQYDAGDTITLPVMVEKNPGFNIMEFYVSYDSDALEYKGASVGSSYYSIGQSIELFTVSVIGSGQIKVPISEGSDTPKDLIGTGKLLDLSFKIREGAVPGEKGFACSLGDDGFFANSLDEDVEVVLLVDSIAVKGYDVRFITDGKVHAQQSLSKGGSISLPADPSKDGFVFKGWDGYDPDVKVTGNIYFTAVWESDSQGGNGSQGGSGPGSGGSDGNTPSEKTTINLDIEKDTVIGEVGDVIVLDYSCSDPARAGEILWRSSDPSVAVVDRGVVTLRSSGSATITSSLEGVSDTCTVVSSEVAEGPSGADGGQQGGGRVSEPTSDSDWNAVLVACSVCVIAVVGAALAFMLRRIV